MDFLCTVEFDKIDPMGNTANFAHQQVALLRSQTMRNINVTPKGTGYAFVDVMRDMGVLPPVICLSRSCGRLTACRKSLM